VTNPQKIKEFLNGRRPQAFCDQCIADQVQLGNLKGTHWNKSIAQQNANAFSRREFPRVVGRCHQCGAAHKLVTRAASHFARPTTR
jgi:hypothetical protein